MEYLTAGKIWDIARNETENVNKQRKIIRQLFLDQDDSGLWPICGKFNASKRAFNHVAKFERESGIFLEPLEYALFIERELIKIVNHY